MFTTAQDAARFALAGAAIFTISSAKTGARYTYRVTAPRDQDESSKRFVGLLTGPDNGADYTYLGTMDDVRNPDFRLTKKSRMSDDSAPVRAFRFVCQRVFAHPDAPLPDGLEIRHEGRCGKCNRKLTVPESIDRGIGPECAARMGMV